MGDRRSRSRRGEHGRLEMVSRHYQALDISSQFRRNPRIHRHPSCATTLNPIGIAFGAAELDVLAFLQAIKAHQKRITDGIPFYALEICTGKNGITETLIGDPKQRICEAVENFRVDFLVMGSRAFGPIWGSCFILEVGGS